MTSIEKPKTNELFGIVLTSDHSVTAPHQWFCARAYSNYAPKAWSELPKSVRCTGSVLAFSQGP